MTNIRKNNSGGVGFTALLTLLFIGLKLTGYITWSWVWVLSPMWIVFLIIFTILMVAEIKKS